MDLRGTAHPAERVGAAPSASLKVEFEIGELDGRILDSDPVEERAAGPASECTAESVGVGGVALDERIRAGSGLSDAEVVVALLAIAAVEQRLLPAGDEREPAVASDFAYRLKRLALFDADA